MPLRRMLLLIALVPTIFMLAFVGTIVYNNRAERRADQAIQRSEATLRQVNELRRQLATSQSALRGYVITSDLRFLAPFNAEISGLVPMAHSIEALVADYSDERALAVEISALVAEYRRFSRRVLFLMLNGDRAAAVSEIGSFRGEDFSRRLRANASALVAIERNLIASENAASDRLRSVSNSIVVGGAILGIILTCLFPVALGAFFLRRMEALVKKTGRFALTGVVDPASEGRDEVAELDRAFFRMAVAVREREEVLERYRLLSEGGLDIIIFARRSDLRIIEANRAAEVGYGYSRAELLQMNARDLRAPAERERLDAVLVAAEGRDRWNLETVHVRRDGTTFPVEIASQIAMVGSEEVVVNVIRDATERERARAALADARDAAMEASRLKSEFVTTMSHEIRTPMNGVIGMSDLLLQTPLNSDQLEFATTIRDSGRTLLAIINDILDFSKIEAGKLELEVIEFEPLSLIEGVADLLAPLARDKRLSLMTYVDPAIPPVLCGDPGRFRQILFNLVGNAVKFTETGCVSIVAALEERTAEATRISVQVWDTGIGMSPQACAKLFQAFTQADGSTTRRFGGTGLGLSISKRLAEAMRGEISVQSKEGEGSTFRFTGWFGNATSLTNAVNRTIETSLSRLRVLRVLIVDDDAMSRQIMQRQIASWGMIVEAFAVPSDAHMALLAAAERGEAFDIAFIDMRMPTIDGFSLGRAILSEPVLKGIRLIMVTAFDDREAARAAIDCGFSAFLAKPIKQSSLLDCIVSVIDRQQDVVRPAPAVRPAAIDAPLRGGRILIAEDNAVNQRVARRQLGKLCSSEIVVVSDGLQAVEAIRQGDFAAVFMDCLMPNLDGYDATRAIREDEALTGKRVPIIAMTANALEEDRERCLAAGMDDYVAKPIDFEELRRVVERWLPESPAAVEKEKVS